jgi:hypothetical protein
MPVEVPAVSLDRANGPLSPKNLMVSFDEVVTMPQSSNSASQASFIF